MYTGVTISFLTATFDFELIQCFFVEIPYFALYVFVVIYVNKCILFQLFQLLDSYFSYNLVNVHILINLYSKKNRIRKIVELHDLFLV